MMEGRELENVDLKKELCSDYFGEEMGGKMDEEQGVPETRLGECARSDKGVPIKEELHVQDNPEAATENASSVYPVSISQHVSTASLNQISCASCHQKFTAIKELMEHQELAHIKQECQGRNSPGLEQSGEGSSQNQDNQVGYEKITWDGQSECKEPEDILPNPTSQNSQEHAAITKDLPESDEANQEYSSLLLQCQTLLKTSSLLVAAASADVTKDGVPAVDVTKDGAPSVDVTKDGAPSVDVAKDGAPSVDVTQDGASSVDVTQDGASSADVTQDGASSVDVSKDGASSVGVAQDGALSADVTQDGASSVDVTKDGAPSADITKDGTSSMDVTQDVESSVDVTQDGASSGCLYVGDALNGDDPHTTNSNKLQGLRANKSRMSTPDQHLTLSQRYTQLVARNDDDNLESSVKRDSVEGRVKQEIAASSSLGETSQASNHQQTDASDLDLETMYMSADLSQDPDLRDSQQSISSRTPCDAQVDATECDVKKSKPSSPPTTHTGVGMCKPGFEPPTTSLPNLGATIEKPPLQEVDLSKGHLRPDLENNKIEGVAANVNLRKYPCFYCGKRFTRSSHRSDHERSHDINKQFRCSFCGKFFTRKRVLLSHEKLHLRGKLGKYSCRTCDVTFYTKEEKQKHVKMHQDSRRFVCSVCNKSYKFSSHLKEHETTHHEIATIFGCFYCGKQFSRKRDLVAHELLHEENAGLFRCVKCNMNFTSNEEKKEHSQIHLNERKYMCSYCGKAYKFASHCRDHERSHDIELQFGCSYCSKYFTRKRLRLAHEMRHAAKGDEKQGKQEEEKDSSSSSSSCKAANFRCWRCKIIFQTKAEKKRHIKTHLRERMYMCCYCMKQFKYGSHYRKHQKGHRVSDRLNCPRCSKGFTKKRLLTAHVQQHVVASMCSRNCYGDEVNRDANSKAKRTKCKSVPFVNKQLARAGEFPCRFCQRVFAQKFHLRAHEVIQHQYMQRCEVCGYGCVTSKQMVEHNKTHVKCEGSGNKGTTQIGQVLMSVIDQENCKKDQLVSRSNTEMSDGSRWKEIRASQRKVRKDGRSGNESRDEYDGVTQNHCISQKSAKSDQDGESREHTDETMQNHGRSDDTHLDSNNRDFKKLSICEFCDRTFRTRNGMLTHQKKKHADGEQRYICPDCPKKFSARVERDAHLREHLSVRPFRCRYCHKRFKKAHHCQEHELLHDVNSQIKCVYCDKGFTTARYLRKHQLGQRRKNPFQCYNCPQVFSIKSCHIHHEKMCGLENAKKPIRKVTTDELWSPLRSIIPEKPGEGCEDGEKDPSLNQQGDNGEMDGKNTRISITSNDITMQDKDEVSEGAETSSTKRDMFEGSVLKYLEGMIDAHIRTGIATPDNSKKELTKEPKDDNDGNEKVFKCKFCRVIFESEMIWLKHEFLHTSREPLSCWYCHSSFQTEALKIEHEARFHLGLQLCQECGTVFKSEYLMQKHSCQNPQADAEYKCERCDEKFSEPQELLDHEKSHRGRRVYSCSYCRARFVNSDSIQFHMETQHGVTSSAERKSSKQRYLACKYCRKAFWKENNLEMHEKGHAGSKPYCCAYCKATFQNQVLLLRHEDKHASDRPQQCTVCGYRFKNRKKLDEHSFRHGESQFRCEHCTRQFSNEYDLFKHEKAHPNIRPYTCKHCSEQFACDVNRLQHTRHKHNVLLPCPLCGQQLATSSALARHLIEHKKKHYSPVKCHQFSSFNNSQSPHRSQNLSPQNCAKSALSVSPGKVLCNEIKETSVIVPQENISNLGKDSEVKCKDGDVVVEEKGKVPEDVPTAIVIKEEKESDCEYTRLPCNRNPTTDAGPSDEAAEWDTSGGIEPEDEDVSETYQCKYCAKVFNDKQNCDRHEILHAPEKLWKCVVCGTSYYTQKMLVDHTKTDQHKMQAEKQKKEEDKKNCDRQENPHTPEKLWKCVVCGTSYYNKKMLVDHTKTDQHKMQAEKQKKEKSKKNCDLQENLNPPEKLWKCVVCGTSYHNKKMLVDHTKTNQHKMQAEKQKKEKRTKTVAKTQMVQDPQSSSSRLKAFFKCDYCSKILTTQLALQNHERLHSGPVPYCCRYCSNTYQTSALRDKHEVIHNSERPFQCRFCGRRFKRCGHKTEHERLHDEARQFKCEVCNNGFTRPIDLWRHERKHPGKGAYTCEQCNSPFFSFSNLQYHWKLKHGNIKPSWKKQKVPKKRISQVKVSNVIPKKKRKTPVKKPEEDAAANRDFQCPKCQACFLNRYHLAEHMVTHDPQSQHKCEVCKKRFVRLIRLWRHEKIHRGVRKHKCHMCKERFFNKGSVKYHLKTKHGVKMQLTIKPKDKTYVQFLPVRSLKCTICSKTFSTKNHLEEHQRIHDPSLQFHCEVCGKSFTRLIRLWRHEVIHKGSEKKYKCTHCRARFYNQGSCDYHLRTHKVKIAPKRPAKQEVFTCLHCSKSFGNAEVARRHEANHTSNRELQHKCTYEGCNEKFPTIVLMEKHFVALHASDRPYKCSFCSRQFKQYGHFVSHEKGHRPETLPYSCEVCKERFVRPRALHRHEQSHKGDRPHKCPKCSVRCFNMVSIMYHKLSQHGIPYRQQGLHKFKNTSKTIYRHKSGRYSRDRQSVRLNNLAKHSKRQTVAGNKMPKMAKTKSGSSGGDAVENTELPVVQMTKIECKDVGDKSKKQNHIIHDISADVFVCELCTEEFSCERELRRHKRFHSVEIEVMQSMLQNEGSGEQSDSNRGIEQEEKIKRKAVSVGRTSPSPNLRRSPRGPKQGFVCHSKPNVKSKNSISKVIQRRTRRAAFRHGIMRRRNGGKKKVVVKNKIEHLLKRLSWDTGLETTNVVDRRFRLRSPQKKDNGKEEAKQEKKTEKEIQSENASESGDDVQEIQSENASESGDDIQEIPTPRRVRPPREDVQEISTPRRVRHPRGDVQEIPTPRSVRPSRGDEEKVIKNGHIPSRVSRLCLESKLGNNIEIIAGPSKRRNKINFLSLLKETEKEREDGMAFVSRVMPVLYNGHCRSCIQCGKRFDTDASLAEHQKFHTCSKRIKCLECNKWCENDKEYRLHWKEHALHRLLYCKHCGKDFPDKEILWRHMKTHNKDGNGNSGGKSVKIKMEEKTHVCDMCSESFVTKEELKLHQVSHTAPRAFVCEHCSMSFNQERQLRSHQTRHVGDLATWQKSFGCPLCGGMFKSSEDLKSHERTFHGFEGGFQCKYCERSFAVEKNWRAHEDVHRSRKSRRKQKC